MTILSTLTAALAMTPFIAGVSAHGNHSPEEIQAELALRRHVGYHSKRALDKCSGSAASVELKERAVARRAATAQALREKRGLQNHAMRRRDEASLSKWAAVSHDQSAGGFTLDTPASTVFGANASCALVPETTIGPYYVEGELIRTDLTDGQTGVPVHLDVQFVDVTTCGAVESLLIDIWHCNSTGVYSGVASQGQGGLNTTHGRGVQQSDTDGVVEFDTFFPGHYTGRATHIHVMSTAGAETLPNGTFSGGTAKNIGQMFFDQDIITAVELVAPYNTNTQELTTNLQDSIAAGEATDEYDPFLKYVMLGDNLSDGLLMWITIAIDTTADYSGSVSAAAHYYEGGGIAESGSGGGGGGGGAGGPGGNGTGPGGPMSGRPSGTAGPSGTSGTVVGTGTTTGTGTPTGTTSSLATLSSIAAAPRLRALWF